MCKDMNFDAQKDIKWWQKNSIIFGQFIIRIIAIYFHNLMVDNHFASKQTKKKDWIENKLVWNNLQYFYIGIIHWRKIYDFINL
jgi:hypothetical protein